MDKKQFIKQKQDILCKDDFSKKGSVDERIKWVVVYINNLQNYYTTSSCSGRIMILTRPKSLKKNETKWLLSSHDKVSYDAVFDSLKQLPHDDLYFRQEGVIIHIACREQEDAIRLMNLARDCGFRRAGIISAENRHVVEIISSEQLNAPIARAGKLIVGDDYLRAITDIANEKMEATFKRIKLFEEKLKKELTL